MASIFVIFRRESLGVLPIHLTSVIYLHELSYIGDEPLDILGGEGIDNFVFA